MLVAAYTDCFPTLPLQESISKLVDLEYSNIEIPLHEHRDFLKPSQIADNLDEAINTCLDTLRMTVVNYNLQIRATGEEYYRQFEACCKLAKATKVVTLTVESGEFGTPFNEEVERLRRLVQIGELEGVRVSMKSEAGRLTEDPDTVAVLCDNVKGLGLTLDPSHYICGPHGGKSIDKLIKYVYHTQLRDTSKEHLQVRVGQGEVEYGRLVNLLQKSGYSRTLCVDIRPLDGIDHMAEMRKMRLLLESLLL